MSRSTADDAVYQFLENHNRPYSAQDISNHLQKDYGKTAIIKALDNLVAKKLIVEKIYGKQKVYLPDQDKLPILDQDEMREMDHKIDELKEKNFDVKKDIKAMDEKLQSLRATLTLAEAKLLLDETSKEKNYLQETLTHIKTNQNLIPENEKKMILDLNALLTKEYKIRRRMLMDILDTILENYPHPKNQLLEEIGIEDMPNVI